VAPGVDVTVLSNNTSASIGSGATVKAKDDVRVDAHASEDILMVGMGIAAGTVGVGGGVSVLTISNETYASIAATFAGGDVVLRASDDTDVMVISGALGAGFVGIGASVGVMVIDKDTQAFVADGAVIDAKGAGTGTDGLFGGVVGTRHGLVMDAGLVRGLLPPRDRGGRRLRRRLGGLTVSLIDSNTLPGSATRTSTRPAATPARMPTRAYTSARATRSTSRPSPARSPAASSAWAARWTWACSRTTSTRASTAVPVISAAGDVEVDARGDKDIDSFVISGAGGFVGVAGAVSVWSVGSTFNRTYSDATARAPTRSAARRRTAPPTARTPTPRARGRPPRARSRATSTPSTARSRAKARATPATSASPTSPRWARRASRPARRRRQTSPARLPRKW
jgi:hypothetical protein